MSLLSNSLKRANRKLEKQRSRQECGSLLEDELWFGSPSGVYDDDAALEGGTATVARLLGRSIPPMEARNASQQRFLNLLAEKSVHLLVAAGPAGCGKTACALYAAVRALCNGSVSKILLTRPAVSAGEELGFLPGDISSKLDPFLRPLFDILYRFWSAKEVQRLMDSGVIEVCPVAFARGRTFCDSFIVCDEMQNATRSQILMLMTRIGPGSKMVLVGDPAQHDRLPGGQPSGFVDLLRRHRVALAGRDGRQIDGIRVFHFHASDVVRHPVVQAVLDLYNDDKKGQDDQVPAGDGENLEVPVPT